MIGEQESQLRSDAYQIFIALFSQHMSEDRWKTLVSWSKDMKQAGGFFTPLFRWLHANTQFPMPDYLAQDYTRLLTGLSQEYGPTPPFESLYRNGAAFCGSHATQIIAIYQLQNSCSSDPYGNQSDHLVNELGYMKELIEKNNTYSLQLEFLIQHLNYWLADWCNAVIQADARGFYAACATALKDFLLHDQAYIEEHCLIVRATNS